MPTSIATDFINFSRGSLATVTDSDGKIKWAGHNFLPNSEQLDNSSVWLQSNVTVAPNAIVAPNGTQTAETFTAGGFLSTVRQAYSSINAILTAGIFAKAGTVNTIMIRLTQAGNGYQVIFNLGTVTAGVAELRGTGGTVSNMVGTISSVGDGWYYCRVTFKEIDFGNVYFGTDATSGTFHMWGAHMYRSDLGGMQGNKSAYPMYYPTTVKNLSKYTEEWGTGNWTNLNTSSTPNATTAPNGLQTADLIYPSSSGSLRQAYHNVNSGTSGTRVVTSIYLKSAGMQWIGFVAPNGANYGCYFDIINGVKGTESAGITGTITAVGGGWYRCSVSEVLSGSAIYGGISFADANGGTTVTASGTSGVYAWGIQFSDSASLDPYVPVYGAAQTSAAYYAPRLDYDGSTLAAKGLLVEESRANLILHSADFTNGAWYPVGATITANDTIAPDGTQTADKLVFTSTTGFIVQDYATTTAGNYCSSMWLRADSATTVYLGVQQSGGDTASVLCNLTTSWQRFSVYKGVTSATFVRFILFSNNNTATFHMWGAQLEAGSFATSYIPTGASTVTRNSDLSAVSTQAFPYNANEGTIVVNVDVFTVNNPINANFYSMYTDGNNLIRSWIWQSARSTPLGTIRASGAEVGFNLGNVLANTPFKTALAYKTNDFGFALNGTAAASVASGNVPAGFSEMSLGRQGTGEYLNGHIRSISYVPKRLTNLELQKRST